MQFIWLLFLLGVLFRAKADPIGLTPDILSISNFGIPLGTIISNAFGPLPGWPLNGELAISSNVESSGTNGETPGTNGETPGTNEIISNISEIIPGINGDIPDINGVVSNINKVVSDTDAVQGPIRKIQPNNSSDIDQQSEGPVTVLSQLPQQGQDSSAQDGQITSSSILNTQTKLFLARSIDYFLKSVSVVFNEFGSYRFKAPNGDIFLVDGLGDFNLDRESITMSTTGNVIGEFGAGITIGPIEFKSAKSALPTEILPRSYTIGGHVVFSATRTISVRVELKSLTIEEELKESQFLSNEALDLVQEFFGSLKRTDFVGTVVKVMKSVNQQDTATQVFPVAP